jgi:plastocyanin
MNRRFTIALAATATLGMAAGGVATAGAAAKRNEIQIVGGITVKPGQFVKDDQRFKPLDAAVKSGATVTLRNKAKAPDPHTISFIEKRFLPKQFETPAAGPLMEAHQVDPNSEDAPPGALVIDNGAPLAEGATLEVDTMGTDKQAGDSAFIAPGQKTFKFKVTADKGSKLFYYCAVHPWMQGKITVK